MSLHVFRKHAEFTHFFFGVCEDAHVSTLVFRHHRVSVVISASKQTGPETAYSTQPKKPQSQSKNLYERDFHCQLHSFLLRVLKLV